MVESIPSIKVYAVGDGAVGKTSLFITFAYGKFPSDYIPYEFGTSTFDWNVGGKKVRLGLWEEAGGEDFDKLRPLSYPDTDVFLICFSLVSPASYENAKSRWHPELKHYCPNVPILLVGTKLDLREDQDAVAQLKENKQEPVSHSDGLRLAKEIEATKYVECSSLIQKGVKEVFEEAVKSVWSRTKSKSSRKQRCVLN